MRTEEDKNYCRACVGISIRAACLFSLKRSSYSGILTAKFQPWQFAHEINLRQYHKEFIWTSPDDRAAVWMRFESTDSKGETCEQTCRNCSQPSSVSGHAERIAFLSGFQFGFSDNCGGQAAFGRWLRARDVASPLGQVSQGYRRSLQNQELQWVKTQRFLHICNGVWHCSKLSQEDEMKIYLFLGWALYAS